MLMSIIVPIYNNEKFISKALSGLCVDNDQYEVILVDDGSTDNSGAICKEYAQKYPQIKYIYQANQGAATARNTGLTHASGEYILFVDSDDYTEERMIPVLAERLACESPVFASYAYDMIDENGSLVPSYCINAEFAGLSDMKEVKELFCEYAERNELNCVWNKVFRRDIIEQHNIRFQKMKFGEDATFVCDYMRKANGKCIFLADVFYHFVTNVHSVTHKYSEQRFENEIRLIATMQECVGEFGIDDAKAKQMIMHKYRNTCLYEIYNLAMRGCKMNVKEKYGRLKYLQQNADIRQAVVTQSEDATLNKREKLLLRFMAMKLYWVVLLYVELKKGKSKADEN